jgi:hypothetical protein
MQCPFDGSELQVVNRSGVDIDWCPSCKGVWLERGELDKLIDLVVTAPRPPATASPEPAYDQRYEQQRYEQRPPQGRDRDRDRDDDDDDWKHRSDRTRKHKKKKNMLSEIFDF